MPTHKTKWLRPAVVFAFVAWKVLLSGCGPSHQPPYAEVLELSGDAYDRGLAHGSHFADKIRSFYVTMVETSLVPFLNREHKNVASFLEEYQKPLYLDGQFSYQTLLQSGENLEEILEQTHPEYIQEMHGVADGSGMPYEKILILNTFADTLLAFSSVTVFIRQIQAPQLLQVDFTTSLNEDGFDNNGDGQTDEVDDHLVKSYRAGQGWSTEYSPRTDAALVEVPTDASLHMIFWDAPGLAGFDGHGDPIEGEVQGMDPDAIRIQFGDNVYTSSEDDCIQTAIHGEDGFGLEVTFTPPGGWPAASEVSVLVQAGNLSRLVVPPPVHARYMRDEHITFTTAGFGKQTHEVINRGVADGRSQPPALGFALRDSASADGQIRLAHHFALLDAATSHKHTVMLVHRPNEGKAHVTIGWAGVIWGFAGMNQDGMTCMATLSDSLDNPLAGQVRQDLWLARLLSTGTPIGIKVRRMLTETSRVADAQSLLQSDGSTFGWNFLLGDADREMAAVEVDSNILDDPDGGFLTFGADNAEPENLDEHGRLYASAGPDDLRIGSHFVKNVPDIDTTILIFKARPQRFWSGYFFRSLRAHNILGERIADSYGSMGLDEMVRTLRDPALVDTRNSMNAVVFEPEQLKLHWAMGQVPATDGDFVPFDLAAFLAGDTQ